VFGGLIIPSATLLITLGLLLGYFIGTGDRGVIQSMPIVAQNAPVASLHAPSILARVPLSNENSAFAPNAGSGATETATASLALSGVSGKNQVGSPNPALKFPTIYFTANSAEVLSSSNPLLLQAVRLIKELPARTLVEITGYTHNIGSPTTNMQLSQRRANAVRRALVHAGVDPAMLTAKGYGSSHSLPSQNGTVEGRSNSLMEDRQRNDRCVEFSIAQQ
jgi:outer membrane protein OmpA-like peptidoglycan-associated protein